MGGREERIYYKMVVEAPSIQGSIFGFRQKAVIQTNCRFIWMFSFHTFLKIKNKTNAFLFLMNLSEALPFQRFLVFLVSANILCCAEADGVP